MSVTAPDLLTGLTRQAARAYAQFALRWSWWPQSRSRMTRRPGYVPALQLQLLEEFTRSRVPVSLVECSGSLTGPDGTRLRDQLLVVLRHGPRHLLLDLAGVTGFDDVAAAILIDTHRRAPAAGCSFGLVAPAEDVVRRLRLTRLDRFLVWHATLEQALSALEPPIDEPPAT